MPGTSNKTSAPQHFRFAEFEFCTQPNELKKAGTPVPLQPQPCRALAFLLEEAGEVVNRQQLRERLWGTETFVDHEQGINFTIRQIRSALDDDPNRPRFIETVPRLGYRFIAPVEQLTKPSIPANPPSQSSPSPKSPIWAQARSLIPVFVACLCFAALAFLISRLERPSSPQLPSMPEPPNAISPSAHEAYLRGRYLLDQGGRGSTDGAIAAFEHTIRESPNFPPGHAALATARLRQRFTKPFSEIAPKITTAAHRALELDDRLAEAYLALATVHLYFEMDWAAAERDFQHALQLNPQSARAFHGYGLYLASLGRFDEAAANIRHAIALSPAAIYAISDLSLVYFWDRRYDAAIAQAQENLKARARHLPSLGIVVDAMMRKEDPEGTLEALNRVFEVAGLPLASQLEPALAQSLEHMISVDEGGYHLDVEIAAAHLDRGKADLALERLQKACVERSDWMLPFIAVDPRFDDLREHPAYDSLHHCLAPRAAAGLWMAHLPG